MLKVFGSLSRPDVFLPSWFKVIKEHNLPYRDIATIKVIIGSADFIEPLQFSQWLYIHGVVTQKKKNNKEKKDNSQKSIKKRVVGQMLEGLHAKPRCWLF